MLANAKYLYALDMWAVEKRPNGWYFSKSAYHGDKARMAGAIFQRITLMIVRELRKEIRKRHKLRAPPEHSNQPRHFVMCGAFLL